MVTVDGIKNASLSNGSWSRKILMAFGEGLITSPNTLYEKRTCVFLVILYISYTYAE